ncbi:Ubiquinone biosynthesis O-methyltransferase, mitochondrial [Paenibacillus sp. JJ-100]|uniref:class I SAM-dependent methyltransferase n=1 Tax=Paenibacillus sp. JJ-100 TaxID=2974896 RepID=UPI0022FF77F5|nr:class I SAM-dependent methyltransferase [Paenibacillus sp. JJ-100]CAI6081306.1 Ubiquinone biosynthesis O-methyltransferase, mitochondrial [Paenibacillus sp. JJ-100]
MNCNVCGEKCVWQEEFKSAPHSVMQGYDSNQLMLHDLEIYSCTHCGHAQIPKYINDEYYDEYAMGAFWGESFKKARTAQMERLIKIAPSLNKFLDIGCGMGHYLDLASPYFAEIHGIEPSKFVMSIASDKGYFIKNDYFHEGVYPNTRFDVITIIEVLEHLENPLGFIKDAANLLNENGILLVEVPNGQRIFEKRLYNNLCTDHIQYFSISSLTILARRAGLSIVCAQESSDPNLLEIFMRKVSAVDETFTNKRKKSLDKIRTRISLNKKVGAWGAGAESSCFLAMLDGNIDISCIFDNDEKKQGHYIGAIPILKPENDVISEYEQIILFANSHKSQIEDQLSKMGFSGELVTFE